jgi:hypothetical protein
MNTRIAQVRLVTAVPRSPGRAMLKRAPSRPEAHAFAGWVIVAASLTACVPSADAPMLQPVEAMKAPWGPFARECDSTRVSRTTSRSRNGDTEVDKVYETCTGFSSMPGSHNSAQITASVGEVNKPSSTVVLRILRNPDGAARAAAPGDTGLLAQGSDVPEAADTLAREIGLTARQLVSPAETLTLPIRLSVPFPLDVVLSCRPDGEHRDHGRQTLVLSCTLDQNIHTSHLEARVQLAGVEEIDVQTGIRLSSLLTGRLNGRTQEADEATWQSTSDRLLYRRDTEFE